MPQGSSALRPRKGLYLYLYIGERAWNAVGDRLQGPCYLSRVDHDRKIRTTIKRTDIDKYCFVNRTFKRWNRLPAGALKAVTCKSDIGRGLGQ